MIRTLQIAASTVLVVAGLTIVRPAASAAEKELTEPGVSVQARGPVHEAFAQPTTATPDPSPLVPKAPPDPIPEEPPDQKPEGANVQWLPGYWSWDAEKKDWLWVSGFWRAPPPARRWVPGHWVKTDDAWRWVAGLWAPAANRELNYVEGPPESLENGPPVPAPDEGSIYVPGLWVFRSGRFLWRPGYWMAGRPDWIWCAAHYLWTPRGFVYVDGYWDYPLEDRGCLFAPVFFDRPLWATPGWCYRPRFAVNVSGLFGSLWVYPSSSCYFFGDYYDPFYSRLGFQPWFSFASRHYDPLFGYYGWRHRSDPGWTAGLKSTFTARSRGELARPAVTFAAQTASQTVHGIANTGGSTPALVTPLAQLKSVGNAKLITVDPKQLSQQRQTVKQFREAAVLRGQTETPKASTSALHVTPGASQDAAPKFQGAGVRASPKPDDQGPARSATPAPTPSSPPVTHSSGEDLAPRMIKGASPVTAPAIVNTPSIVTTPSSSPVIIRSAPVSPPPARSAPPPSARPAPPPPAAGGGHGGSGGGGHGGFSTGGGHAGGSSGHGGGGHGGAGGHSPHK